MDLSVGGFAEPHHVPDSGEERVPGAYIVDYRVASGTIEEVTVEVKSFIEDGWQPYGSLQAAPMVNAARDFFCMQAVVRYEYVRAEAIPAEAPSAN